jgi:glycosyltransferase involved in cell wall biosynthesis
MRNEGKYIEKCLDSILYNDFPREQYEIIVVDGDSTDDSRELVLRKATEFPCIRLLRNSKRIVPPGLNLAIREARGRYIIRMDAHAEYPPDYVTNCIYELKRTGAANVGGRCLTKPGADTDVARAIALLTQTSIGVGNSAFRLGAGDRYVDTVPFGAFRCEVFDQVGPFREDLIRSQDYELNARIRKAGGRIYLSPRIYATYYNASTFAQFMRQGYVNGLWAARAWIRYPVSFCYRHAAPLVFITGLVGLIGLSFFRPGFRWILAAALSVYFFTVFFGSWGIACRHGARFFWLTSALVFCHHCVYGIGSWHGVLTGRISHRGVGKTQSRSSTNGKDPAEQYST